MTEKMTPLQETDTEKNYTVTEIPSLDVGNPESSISYTKQIASGELQQGVVDVSIDYIVSGKGMWPITDNDDGCIDGRSARRVLFVAENGEFSERPIADSGEHLRAKVAGGGYITTLAMRLGAGKTSSSIEKDLDEVVQDLAGQNIFCGAHTGEHAHDGSTDCGANDKFAQIISNGIRFRETIDTNARALIGIAGISIDDSITKTVFKNWESASEASYGSESTGEARFSVIEDGIKRAQSIQGGKKPVAVSKDLQGDHKEDFILINYGDSETFSQAAFARMLAEQFPDVPEDKRAQAFVVDVPRIVKLAKAVSKNDEEFYEALYAGVAYQLATAATLTDGTLRTFTIQQ